jgi:hypothetical protein
MARLQRRQDAAPLKRACAVNWHIGMRAGRLGRCCSAVCGDASERIDHSLPWMSLTSRNFASTYGYSGLVPIAEAPAPQAGVRVQPAAAQHQVLTVKKVRRVLWVERVSLKPCTNTHIASAGQVSTDRGQLCVGRGAADVMPRNVSARQPAEDVQPSGPPGSLQACGSRPQQSSSQRETQGPWQAPAAAAAVAAGGKQKPVT